MSMTSWSAQEEGRSFVVATKVEQCNGCGIKHVDRALLPTLTYCNIPNVAAQTDQNPSVLTYKSGESLRADSRKSNKGDVSISESNDNDNGNNSNGKDPFVFALHKKQMRKQKSAHKTSKRLFDRIAKESQKDQSWRASPPPMPTTPEKIEEAYLLKKLDWMVPSIHHCLGCYDRKCKFCPWVHQAYNLSKARENTAQHKLPSKDQNDNNFKQDWFMGIDNQLMIWHCLEWAEEEPTCARSFASMEYPLFARDIKDMEASTADPDIQLAQSWESPTIDSKATWDSQSHKHPRFA
eukprot:jgi/Psemu1/44841/gm1.44841_g